jgi:hypothetical protein
MRLHPLTIGHLAILHEAESPFVTYLRDITRDDLIFAVGCCAQPYESAARFEAPPSWFERLELEWVTWKWARAIRDLDLTKECERFAKYLRFHRRLPDAAAPKGRTRQFNSPTEWRLIAMLMEDFGQSWAQAMNTPVLRAHALWATQGDREGWIELHPNDPLSIARDKEFQAWAKEEDAKAFGKN